MILKWQKDYRRRRALRVKRALYLLEQVRQEMEEKKLEVMQDIQAGSMSAKAKRLAEQEYLWVKWRFRIDLEIFERGGHFRPEEKTPVDGMRLVG